MLKAFLILGFWLAIAVLQPVLSHLLTARRCKQERERRDRKELRELCRTIEEREDQAEHRRWSKR